MKRTSVATLMAVLLAILSAGCSQSDSYQRGRDAGREIAAEGYLNQQYAEELCSGMAAMDGGDAADFIDGCMDGWEASAG